MLPPRRWPQSIAASASRCDRDHILSSIRGNIDAMTCSAPSARADADRPGRHPCKRLWSLAAWRARRPDEPTTELPDRADVVVVGAGHNSLVAAGYLAAGRAGGRWSSRPGPTVGGNTRTEELTLPGFAHDSCSSAHVLIQANPLIRDDELGLRRRPRPGLRAHRPRRGPAPARRRRPRDAPGPRRHVRRARPLVGRRRAGLPDHARRVARRARRGARPVELGPAAAATTRPPGGTCALRARAAPGTSSTSASRTRPCGRSCSGWRWPPSRTRAGRAPASCPPRCRPGGSRFGWATPVGRQPGAARRPRPR